MGFFMRKFDYPITPANVGLILGPMADSQLRRALQMSQGDPMILLQHPSTAIMFGLATLALIAPLIF